MLAIFRFFNYFDPNSMKFFKSVIEDNFESCTTFDELSKIEYYLYKFEYRMTIQYNNIDLIENYNEFYYILNQKM